MLKYLNTEVTCGEVPDEITLCINITNCKNACPGCHSPYLANDIGEELNEESLSKLIDDNFGISCVCFMGGDIDPKRVQELAKFVKKEYKGEIKTAWYSGRNEPPSPFNARLFDFVKIGAYMADFGALTSRMTNQHFYRVENGKLIDETYKFWK